MPEHNERTAQTAETAVAIDLPFHRSSDYQSIYVDHVKFGATAFEVSQTYGVISETPEGELYVEQKLRILMSPLLAKILATVLMQNLDGWEKKFGEIKLPGVIQTVGEYPKIASQPPSEK